MKTSLSILLLLIIFNACRTAYCESWGANVKVLGFDSTEVLLVQVTTYRRGSNFSEKLEDIVMSSAFNASNGKDSVKLYKLDKQKPLSYFVSHTLKTDRDVLISIPALSKEYKIRDFNFIDTKRREIALGAGEMDQCTDDAEVYINDVYHKDEGSKLNKYGNAFEIDK